MPNYDVSFNSKYANGDTRRETYHEPDQPDIGAAIARASTRFFEDELQEGRTAPIGLAINANQR